jgi:phospholipid/cholesterol/gamma-HCH transport system ATP-binding protein
MSLEVIRAENLTIGYASHVLLENVSFSLGQSEIVVILGGSGSGKSTLMKHLIGLYAPLAGDILIEGCSIVNAFGAERAALQRKLGILYQNGGLFGSMSVIENVRFPLDEFTDMPDEAKELTARLQLDIVAMADARDLMPAELSGGMLKRVAIARAMVLGSDILMLDEPSSGLDPITAANLDQTILSLRDMLGVTFVVVTHELPSIFEIADRALMLDAHARGIIADGKPAALRDHSTDPRVRQFFNRLPDRRTGRE